MAVVKEAKMWHNVNIYLERRRLYNRAGSAKKRQYPILAEYYRALADSVYAHEQNNYEEVIVNAEKAREILAKAYLEYRTYVEKEGEMV